MPERQPGLDEVLDDDALDRFIDATPLEMIEPPRRIWPHVTAAMIVGAAAGTGLGFAVARLPFAAQVVVTYAVVVAAVVAGTVWYRQDK